MNAKRNTMQQVYFGPIERTCSATVYTTTDGKSYARRTKYDLWQLVRHDSGKKWAVVNHTRGWRERPFD